MKRILIAGNVNFDAVETTPTYLDAVRRAGAVAAVAYARDAADAEVLCAAFDALLLPGGRDLPPFLYGEDPHPANTYNDPARDRSDRLLFDAFRAAGKRVLGICRGCQAVNVFMGGSLVQHIQGMIDSPIQHASNMDPGHRAEILPGTLLARLFGAGEKRVTSSHHQSIKRPAEGLTVSARAADGIVEAAEGDDILLIQWHPERMGEAMLPVFQWIAGEEKQA